MKNTVTSANVLSNKKVVLFLLWMLLAFISFTLFQDFIEAKIKNTAFYFSESFLFSSFWWLFVPLLFAQYSIVKRRNIWGAPSLLILISLPFLIHVIAFPLLVWIISNSFYYHTYAFQQTFRYTLSEHLFSLAFFYSIPVLTYSFFTKIISQERNVATIKTTQISGQFIDAILITEGYKKYSVAVSDILFISAQPPYINIVLENKKHLHAETLKSIVTKLNPTLFIRIHKSTIVNIKMVDSYSSRLNGDYDLTMKNNEKLRVSRNYAKDFMVLFNQTNRFTTQ